MILSETEALLWIGRITGFSILIQTIEFFSLRRHFVGSQATWDWTIIKKDFEIFPHGFRAIFEFLLRPQIFVGILGIRLILAMSALVVPGAWIFVLLWVSTLLICLRWRGTFNGGSDFMTLIVLLGLAVGYAKPVAALGSQVGLAYIAAQSCISYFVAGVVKLKSPDWRNGRALEIFLNRSICKIPNSLQRWVASPVPSMALSWGVMSFECLFPSVFLHPVVAWIGVGGGLIFHALNAWFLGLNRFFWAWASTYPALIYWSDVIFTNCPL